MKTLVGLVAAAAMLALPALSQADEIQRSHPEDAQVTQSQKPTPAGDNAKPQTNSHENKPSNGRQAAGGKTKSSNRPTDTDKTTMKPATSQKPTVQGNPAPSGNATVTVDGTTLTVHSPEGGSAILNRNELWNKYDSTTVPITMKFTGGTTSLPQDSSGLFSSMNRLTSIEGLDKVDTSNVTNMREMFEGVGLAELDLSHFDTNHVTDMSSMFQSCENLAELDLSSLDTSNVTDMSSMFWGCGSLTKLDLSSLDTSNVTDMSWMCRSCYNLVSVDMSGLDTRNVHGMAFMFMECYKLASVDMSGLDNSNASSYVTGIFTQCRSLKQLRIGAKTNLWTLYDAQLSPDDNYTGLWIQLPEPGTQSADVNPDTTYTGEALADRTTTSSPDKAGTYVRQQRLTLKPSSTLPSGTSVTDPSGKTMLGGVATIKDADGHDTLLTSFKAPGSKYTLAGGDAGQYRFAGWSERDNAATADFHEGDDIDADTVPGRILYQIWTKSLPVPMPSPSPSPTPGPSLTPTPNPSTSQNPNPGMPSAPTAPSNPGRNAGLGSPASPLMLGAATTAQAMTGGDHTDHTIGGNTAKPQARGHKSLKCEPVSYIEGTLVPASNICAGDTTATVGKAGNTRQMPLWIFLLIAAITVAALVSIKRNDDFTVVQHRAADTTK
ncbi:BspA family leucine-rich repeat surface protein [Bifidobacterium sp. ESL0763]|uniref:BspA family leucine-rich repeat surface protein n=1 Tax=Bifidobacterium sp. ESL0763 TaxID=2983227 RepID=UPI0023F97DEC|nr:BspA family leucine-rich repeat surface protein [Bifidobacterium sp. ESL0763]MDF7664476.1 BspA family leucine-rich repeat surface protein [Bifidobacterium sp. ESL0763]